MSKSTNHSSEFFFRDHVVCTFWRIWFNQSNLSSQPSNDHVFAIHFWRFQVPTNQIAVFPCLFNHVMLPWYHVGSLWCENVPHVTPILTVAKVNVRLSQGQVVQSVKLESTLSEWWKLCRFLNCVLKYPMNNTRRKDNYIEHTLWILISHTIPFIDFYLQLNAIQTIENKLITN